MNEIHMNYYAIPGLKKDPAPKKIITDDNIISAVCWHTGVYLDKIKDKERRTDEITLARHIAYHFLFNFTTLNKSEIGRKLNRDHTTIIYALRTIKNRIDTDDNVRELVEKIKNHITA
jgi:chromosomal replication initiator protein